MKENRTVKGGTMTSEGFIEHKKHPLGFDMPVKLIPEFGTAGEAREFMPPKRDRFGQLVYALPGG